MSTLKLSLVEEPTFSATVRIPVPGKASAPLKVTFKFRNRDQWKEFVEKLESLDNVTLVQEMATGWELADTFDAENIAKFDKKYLGGVRAMLDVYIAENTGAPLGN